MTFRFAAQALSYEFASELSPSGRGSQPEAEHRDALKVTVHSADTECDARVSETRDSDTQSGFPPGGPGPAGAREP